MNRKCPQGFVDASKVHTPYYANFWCSQNDPCDHVYRSEQRNKMLSRRANEEQEKSTLLDTRLHGTQATLNDWEARVVERERRIDDLASQVRAAGVRMLDAEARLERAAAERDRRDAKVADLEAALQIKNVALLEQEEGTRDLQDSWKNERDRLATECRSVEFRALFETG